MDGGEDWRNRRLEWRRHWGGGPRFPWVGLLLLLLGTWWLLGKMGYLDFDWSYAWPLAMIAAGLGILINRMTWRS
jgi:hypothetical protein